LPQHGFLVSLEYYRLLLFLSDQQMAKQTPTETYKIGYEECCCSMRKTGHSIMTIVDAIFYLGGLRVDIIVRNNNACDGTLHEFMPYV